MRRMLPGRAGDPDALPNKPGNPDGPASPSTLPAAAPAAVFAPKLVRGLLLVLLSPAANQPPETLLLPLGSTWPSAAAAAGDDEDGGMLSSGTWPTAAAAAPSAAGAVDGLLLAANRLRGTASPVLPGVLLSVPAAAADPGLAPRASDVRSGDRVPGTGTAAAASPALLPGLDPAPAVLPKRWLKGRLGLPNGKVRGMVVRLASVLDNEGCSSSSSSSSDGNDRVLSSSDGTTLSILSQAGSGRAMQLCLPGRKTVSFAMPFI
jgi:hypothetical protein